MIVDYTGIRTVGQTPQGLRRIAPVSGGSFTGERLCGSVQPGTDWVINRADGVMLIDVRLTLLSDDDALIYLSYQGRFLAAPEAMARLAAGRLLEAQEYSLAISAKFECGDARYAWLNDAIVVGTGQQTPTGPLYALFEVG